MRRSQGARRVPLGNGVAHNAPAWQLPLARPRPAAHHASQPPPLRVPPHTPTQAEAEKKIPLEVAPAVKHTLGVLSMGRHADPNSGTSSFSILLGTAGHLDMQYTIFGNGEGALAGG